MAATPLADALLYAAAPAALGAGLAAILLANARRELVAPVAPRAQGRLTLLFVLPTAAVAFGLVAAFIASAAEHDLTTPLLAVGVAAFGQATLQGWLGGRRVRAIAEDAAALGPALVVLMLPELLMVGALLWLMMRIGGA